METWDIKRTAEWLCQITRDKKYATACEKKGINGQALLLLADRRDNQLASALDLKKGPLKVLMNDLKPYLESFKQSMLQKARCSSKALKEWTVQELCSWLREQSFPEECVALVKMEEIDGRALLLLREDGELKDSLQLKEGPWIVLEHELFFLLEERGDIKTETTSRISTNENTQSMPVLVHKGMVETKEPLTSEKPSAGAIPKVPPKVVLSEEDGKLALLRNSLNLDIGNSKTSDNTKECVIRSIGVKRGKDTNALEKLLNFVVITKEEMSEDKSEKLWSKMVEKTSEWMKLLPENDFKSFFWDSECHSFVHEPSAENVALRKGEVFQIPLERLSDEYKQGVFIIMVDKQLLDDKTIYNFFLDRKCKKISYSVKLTIKSKYHGAFDPERPSQDFKLSTYFKSLLTAADECGKKVNIRPPTVLPKLSVHSTLSHETLRPFGDSEFEGRYYNEGWVLPAWETGPKDLITPVHEFKLLRRFGESSDKDTIKKFLYETMRFACGCLNERTNGTIHYGVADEVAEQACGYHPREIVGTSVTDKPRYYNVLVEFIRKCFVGDSRSIVLNCIRPPVFIPVKGKGAKQPSNNKVVIEVDVEPSYSYCAKETFKVGFKSLGKGREEAAAYIRCGSETQAIVEVHKMEEYRERRDKLDEERRKREEKDEQQVLEKPDDLKHLHVKLKRLLCANKNALDSSVYPILILSKPGAKMNQEYFEKTFRFIEHVKWKVIIDFDDQGSDNSGLCKVFKAGGDLFKCDIHEAEDYDENEDEIEGIDGKTHWIFGNGYAKLGKESLAFKQWNNSKRKRGLSLVIQSLAKKLPRARAVVLFMLLSEEYEPMADTFKDFCTYLDGPNQLVYAAESSEIVADWVAKLSSTCLEEHELRDRGVVGMSWSEFQECMQQMVGGIDRQQRYVIMSTGTPYPLEHVTFNNIDIVSARECEELRALSSTERNQISFEEERNFYRGYPVTWRNFWFSDAQKIHVLRRDNYKYLKKIIEEMHSKGTEGKVQTITIYHHIGAGASTMARQALWDFRYNSLFPYRCAVVKKIDNNTCKEILLLRKVGYSGESVGSIPPVLALVEDTEDYLFRELRSQIVEEASKLPKTEWPVCVFLFCKPVQKPYACHFKLKKTSVYLEQCLSSEEKDWFKHKYTEMKGNFKDPEEDFETYANENLISFMIMKEGFNPKYVSSIVERNLIHVTNDELTLLQYTSLLSIFNPYPVFASCFDSIMLSASLLRKKIFRDWVEDLTHSARIFLQEKDRSTDRGTGKAITIVHPVIASTLLDQIAAKADTTVGQIAVDFLESPLLENKGKWFTTKDLCDATSRMLKHRKKYDYGDDEETKFSPLIEKILNVKGTGEGQKQPTEESIDEAAKVLRVGLDKFEDPMLAQQMARVFYVNAAAFSESTIDSCFVKAHMFCDEAIKMSPKNSFLFDTKGRIYERKMKVLFGPIRTENRVIGIKSAIPALQLAFKAMEWFQKSVAASVDYQNNYGLHGELSVLFYMLDVLSCVMIFRGEKGKKMLQAYLSFCQEIPDEVKEDWQEYHEPIKELRNRFIHCIDGLSDDFTVFKGNRVEEKALPGRIVFFKKQYQSYFGESDIKWNDKIPQERWEQRWHKINQHLTGDIFSSVFTIHWETKTPAETLQELKSLAYKNYGESALPASYKDMLLIVSTSMALHSPYGNISKKQKTLVEEYREIFHFVEKLYALEECNEGPLRLYAHLFKVMFLWPREDLELTGYRVQDFYDAMEKLKNRWERKCKGYIDLDKMHKEKMHKNMSFRKETRQYTTLFYLGKGSGLDVFVHINELSEKGSPDWESPKVKRRLARLTGIVESKNIIRVKNSVASGRTIDVYFSTFRLGGFSKEEVSFYLGFSWPQPIAFDVQYTSTDHMKHSMEFSGPIVDDQFKFGLPKYNDMTYEEYTKIKKNLSKTLSEIDHLKKKRERGEVLEKNQVSY